jgi:HlyD family secretion protein
MGQRGHGFGGAASAFGGGAMPQKPKRPQTVYVLGKDNKLTPVDVRTGISDGRYTQVVDGAIKEGDLIVTGTATSKIEGPAAFGGAGQPGRGGVGRGR